MEINWTYLAIPPEWELKNIPSAYLSAPEYQAYIAPPASRAVLDPALLSTLPVQLWSALTQASGNMSWCPAVVPARMLCYRALAASLASGKTPVGQASPTPPRGNLVDASLTATVPVTGDDLLAWWRRSLPFVTQADRDAYDSAMAQAWKQELVISPALKRNDL